MPEMAGVMTRSVRSMAPTETLQFAALAMDALNVGVIPLREGNSVGGVVNDRDVMADMADPPEPDRCVNSAFSGTAGGGSASGGDSRRRQ